MQRANIAVVDTERARGLAQTLLAASLPRRWRHVQGVASTVMNISDGLPLDRDTVIASAWLHDIGYAPGVRVTGLHALDGARYLRRAGWSEAVCRLVAHHTAARVEAASYGIADELNVEFPDARSLDRDVLWVADATTGPEGQPMSLDARIAEVRTRYGPGHRVTEAMQSSAAELREVIGRVERQRARQRTR